MAHYAKVFDGKVIQVIVATPSFFEEFTDDGQPGEWLQTSYNTYGGVHYDPETREPSADQTKALRKNYAGIGFSYDNVKDAFIPPQPYTSWSLNEETCLWECPVEKPDTENFYSWNEENQTWDLIDGN